MLYPPYTASAGLGPYTLTNPPRPLNVLCRSRNRWRSGTFASVNQILHAKACPQFRFHNLASRVAGQRVNDLQRLRMLVPRKPLGEELIEITEVYGVIRESA